MTICIHGADITEMLAYADMVDKVDETIVDMRLHHGIDIVPCASSAKMLCDIAGMVSDEEFDVSSAGVVEEMLYEMGERDEFRVKVVCAAYKAGALIKFKQ